jgi:hypothetical protein
MKKYSIYTFNITIVIALVSACTGAGQVKSADNRDAVAALDQAAQVQAQKASDQENQTRPTGQPEAGRRDQQRAERLYENGTRALNKHQWDDAVGSFDELIKTGGERSDGARYWKAYALNKKGNRDEALASLSALAKESPQSRWLDDAKELEVEIRQANGQPVNPDGQPDEELKLLALDGLMRADPEKALPLLRKLLSSAQPLRLKEQALFVLSQSDSPQAKDIMRDFARGKGNPDLQLKSLEYLALLGGNANGELLQEVYTSTNDKHVKHALLNFFMMRGDRERLLAAAKSEKDADLRRNAVDQLGNLGANKELSELYAEEKSKELKTKILEALFVGGDTEKLLDLAQHEEDRGLRLKAIQLLGQMDPAKTGANLAAIYDSEKDHEIRTKIIESLFVQGNAGAIVAIARAEKDPGLKKKAIEQLSVMGSKEGTAYFEEILNK